MSPDEELIRVLYVFAFFFVCFILVSWLHFSETGGGIFGKIAQLFRLMKPKNVGDIVRAARYRADDHRGI